MITPRSSHPGHIIEAQDMEIRALALQAAAALYTVDNVNYIDRQRVDVVLATAREFEKYITMG